MDFRKPDFCGKMFAAFSSLHNQNQYNNNHFHGQSNNRKNHLSNGLAHFTTVHYYETALQVLNLIVPHIIGTTWFIHLVM